MIDTEAARAFLFSVSTDVMEQGKVLTTTSVSMGALLAGLATLTAVAVIYKTIVSMQSKAEQDMARAKRKAERRTAVDRMHDALFEAYHSEEISKATYTWAMTQLGDAGFTDMRPHWERIKCAGKMGAQELSSHLARLKQSLKAKHPEATGHLPWSREKKEEPTSTINVEAA